MLKPHAFKGHYLSRLNGAEEICEPYKVGVKAVIYAPSLKKARRGAKQVISGFQGEMEFLYQGDFSADTMGVIAHTVR